MDENRNDAIFDSRINKNVKIKSIIETSKINFP